jgi:type II secretory pathway component PulC
VTAGQNDGGLGKRFRLAGTFFAYGAGESDSRKAILDDIRAGAQRIVSEGDELGDVAVLRIFRDRVRLRGPGGEEDLWQSFSGGVPGSSGASGVPASAGGAAGVAAANRFGMQVGSNEWVFQRRALMDYYRELMDDPERLVQVFDSMKPQYNASRKITGYTLDVEGEAGFFRDMGLLQGDTVRRVNGLEMSNRRRAEFFIKEFVADRANAFRLEIERGGQPLHLVYQTR